MRVGELDGDPKRRSGLLKGDLLGEFKLKRLQKSREKTSFTEMRPNQEHSPSGLSGSLPTLTILIRSDPQILHRVSLSSQPENPFHITALSGHLDFTKALLTVKPELASWLDSFECSPLHLASTEGHTEIVKALLPANIEVCLVADEEGRIPLHLAATRGKVEIIQELINAKPDSIRQKLNGSTFLHLCIQYNQLEALKQFLTLVDENQLLDFTDHGGNTILHLAVMLRQLECINSFNQTITYLVLVPGIKAKINVRNKMGLSALDLLKHYPRDFKSLEIGDIILIKAESRRSPEDPNPAKTVPIAVGGEIQAKEVKSRSFTFWLKGKTKSVYQKCKSYFKHQSNWVEEMQGPLMVVATLTATVSFQVAISPPGGVWQQDYTDLTACGFNRSVDYGKCVAGKAMLGYVNPLLYRLFTIYAIVSFISSLNVVLLAISGVPLKNKLCTWLMTIAMIIAITLYLDCFGLNCCSVCHHPPSLLAIYSSDQVNRLLKENAITSIKEPSSHMSYVVFCWIRSLCLIVVYVGDFQVKTDNISKVECGSPQMVSKQVNNQTGGKCYTVGAISRILRELSITWWELPIES
ncbi:ankyrin repeat-containing protein ITN1-like [Durio zibethinus]|uniref:Ankyrin repeat-containing protein ITN1-like n=1 Tax=Durio zibethinus TaxID=66656 RepID=A0A6P5X6H2_DURZI|nr:ankyrin repeat-containing protein ITN1-like [Durio zibethinus]